MRKRLLQIDHLQEAIDFRKRFGIQIDFANRQSMKCKSHVRSHQISKRPIISHESLPTLLGCPLV
jgi:hypothetical protein